MKRPSLTCLLLLGTALVVLNAQRVTIFPSGGSIIAPPTSNDVTLACGLEPDTLIPSVNYTTRWRLPGGEIVNSMKTTINSKRYVFSENLFPINGKLVPGTSLIVFPLSYQDAGMYTCEGRSTAPGASAQWATTSFELRLNLNLLSYMTTMTTMNDTDTIALYCEMRAYIRPDSSLVWEGPGGQRITGGTGKHQITFSDGTLSVAVNGSGVHVPSRVSTLIIINPEPSDDGTYTCSVMGTSEAVTIELVVNGRNTILGTTADGTQTNSTTNLGNNDTLHLTFIAILTGLLVITTVAICYCMHARNACTKVNNLVGSNPIYDYILTLPGLDPDDHGIHHHNVQAESDESTATRTDGVVNDVISDDLTIERNYDEPNDNLNTCAHDSINTTEINVEHGVTVDSEMNVACGLTTDGISNSEKSVTYGVHTDDTDTTTEVNMIYDHLTTDADMTEIKNEADCVATDGIDTMERNIAYDVADTISMDNNEAYGVAIDGIGIDTMNRNIAYSAVLNQNQDDSAGDADTMVDDDIISCM